MWGLRVLQTFKHENLVGSFILGFGTPRDQRSGFGGLQAVTEIEAMEGIVIAYGWCIT